MVRTRGRKNSAKRNMEDLRELDYEDEIEKNAKIHRRENQSDVLEMEADYLSESDEGEVLLSVDDSSSDDVAEDATDNDLDSEEEIEKGTKYGKLLQQARAIKKKLDIKKGEEESSEEDSEESIEVEKEAWGSRKSAYYDADLRDMEGSEDEDDLREEEEEARKLQKEAMSRVDPEDFGSLDEDTDNEDQAELVEDKFERELVSPDEDELRIAAVRQDALELKALIEELRLSLSEMRGRVVPLMQEIRSGNIATSEGVSYLEAKHLLLMYYNACIVFYLLLKAEGKNVKDHPVVSRLVEIRAYLEKVRPIDKRLKYQIEKLLAAANLSNKSTLIEKDNEPEEQGELSYRPKPGTMVVEDPKGNRDGEQAYRPPKINPVSMEQDQAYSPENTLSSKEKRKQIQASRRAARSDFIQEFAAELTGAPEEKRMGAPVGMDTADALRTRQRLAARENVEEELMIRVPLSKEERKSLKAQRRAGLSGKALLDDFADDIADLVDGKDLGIDSMHSRHKANQRYGAEIPAIEGKWGGKSGDDDLPTKESLRTRRAKMDNLKVKNVSTLLEDSEVRGKSVGEETEFYKASKKHIDSHRQQKRMKNAPDALFPPLEDPLTSGARQIDKAIEKNRGLTPHRRKDLKNPRKKHRIKYAEANIRRKGQVQSVKTGAAGAYGGESTGIKSKLSKSVKL
eukprot:jgi/Picsp_1/4515/NSC_06736-R1_sas10 utp3 c1d family